MRPGTIFDIGAARGDWSRIACRVFPNAALVLIEPLDEFANSLRAIAHDRPRTILVRAVASAASGEVHLNVHADLVGSSILLESGDPVVNGVARTVASVTVDELVARHALKPPYLIKMDVQGAELRVLDGAREAIQHADAIIAEASLLPFFEGGPLLRDLVAALGERGFLAYDIFGATHRPLDGALAQVDLVFAPEAWVLRQDPRFATSEQRDAQDAAIRRDLARSGNGR
jgi:FkbM family methyltransferase